MALKISLAALNESNPALGKLQYTKITTANARYQETLRFMTASNAKDFPLARAHLEALEAAVKADDAAEIVLENGIFQGTEQNMQDLVDATNGLVEATEELSHTADSLQKFVGLAKSIVQLVGLIGGL